MNWHDYFKYDNGNLYRIWGNGKVYLSGSRAKTQYILVTVDGVCTWAHRVIWEMHNGPIPKGMWVDHINGNGRDNRLSNLRLSLPHQNSANAKLSKRNSSGAKGVTWNKRAKKWHAQISYRRNRIYLGLFTELDEAAAAYASAAKNMNGEFARMAYSETRPT